MIERSFPKVAPGDPSNPPPTVFAADQSIFDPADPYVRTEQTFPHLSPEMIDRVCTYGASETIGAGGVLASPGQRGVDFFVITSGRVGIFARERDGTQSLIVEHDAGQFTGELDLLNERESLVEARVIEDAKIVRLDRPSFQRMIVGEPDAAEIILRAVILRRMGIIRYAHNGLTVIGRANDGATLEVQRFLLRNGYPLRVEDADESPQAQKLMAELSLDNADLPAVVLASGVTLRRPTIHALADAIGLMEPLDPARVHDIVIVGAGPGGLAAAVYAASEGLDTIVIEGHAPGGQAGTSSRIENYLGFPTGVSGQALAGRAHVQAQKFGARLAISRKAVSLDCSVVPYRLVLDDGSAINARAIVIATGARYRRLGVRDDARYEGRGIHYAATAMEANLAANQEVVVVGGGNSAGQAAIFLSRGARHVHILVRGDGLAATMSDYLIQRIASSPKITLHSHTVVSGLSGEPFLRKVDWRNTLTGKEGSIDTSSLFVMVGAEPNTTWLGDCVHLDERGFVLTGQKAGRADDSMFETSLAGVFAIGDVRSASVKRVASAVGEGSVVVSAIHQFLDPA
ncbi:cyclic nucleotide-regulated FAD-dependent pyridine nucleotide-disulphide oxidoreductase [Sphingobium sp. AP50]|uniref:FAD-dependent oxidoreductase n=1 Tax=Sphingobium sp. AP50 TaxID=1884369 RepID=UPI0008B6A7C0|nr:cyclic nucleotide-binding domain-containing thioredoxin-disulfide reductase [Sphingobium sp. AP50]SEJ81938.1 cyclic nucleotide-regulated FAD-dependent pyridine nucleotide-disulphide oxidoreductase [Sphingobium sp. AP50]